MNQSPQENTPPQHGGPMLAIKLCTGRLEKNPGRTDLVAGCSLQYFRRRCWELLIGASEGQRSLSTVFLADSGLKKQGG
jgi:hypothetical protein